MPRITDGDSRGRAIERLKAEISQRSTRKDETDSRAEPPGDTVPTHREEDLTAQSRYHAERLALYRAKMHGSTPTSPRRLKDLEQASQDANRRLRHHQLRSEPPHDAQSKAPGEGD